ncbi:HbrB-domain-containing protein [Paraphaeosphaeria sporulosa]|uniref:HbrB-domain-containing protein n=1 Tax=Paraphaeosphaeria sporulosa TaxID=1460663 RepID=A0A177CBD2_9PLEO|nr:HbrB-domain-containing protein [Paraphaeosphaeria sporulosa]OAG04993.1 HbrB-domain-containing protein [Paraphaeosphaeria sporulosa]
MSTKDQEEKPYQQGWHPSVTANHATRTAENEAAFLLPRLKPNFHILDMGCGPGTITTGLANHVPQGSITGVDLTPEIIAQAKQLAEQQNGGAPKNVEFSTGNVLEGLPFADETFDVVWMSQVLLHIPEPVKALKELRRVLKTGGFIADREGDFPFHWYPYLPGLQLKSKYQYEMVITRRKSSSAQPHLPPHGPDHRSGSMIHVWAREAGFDPLKIEKSARVTMYSTPEERKVYAGHMIARMEQGGHRQKYEALGASKEDVDLMVRDLERWREDPDGVHHIVHCASNATIVYPAAGGTANCGLFLLAVPRRSPSHGAAMQSTSPPPQTPTIQRPDAFDESDSDSSQVTLQRRSPLPRRAVRSPQPQPGDATPNYSRPAPPRDRDEPAHPGPQLGHRPRQRSQGYFEPSLPSNQASMSNLDASRIAAQTAMQPQHMRKRSTTIPEPGASVPSARGPSSPPPVPGQHTVTFRTNGMTYQNGLAGGGRMAAASAANAAYPRSPLHSPNLQQPPEHGSPKPAAADLAQQPKAKEKSKMKLFSKPKNIKTDKGLEQKHQALPSPGKIGIGIHSSQALNRMMMNPSQTSLVEPSMSSAASIYSTANGSTSTLVPRNDSYLPTVHEKDRDKHKHHFLSRPKKKEKDDHILPLSSASSTSRLVDPNAPQPLYSFAAPASPGHASSFANSVTGLDLRHGGRHLRRAKKEEKAYLDAQLEPAFRDRKQSFSTDRSEWPSAGSVGTTPMSTFGPSSSAALSQSSDAMHTLGSSFNLPGITPDDAWPLLKATLLLIFAGEDPRPPVEDFNALVIVHIKRCIQKRSPIILIEDLNELLMTGFGSLDQTLRHVPDDRLIPHLVEMWIVVFTTILPFIQAVFLPLDLEFRGSGIMSSTAAAEFWGVKLPDEMNTKSPENKNIPILGELDVRRITLLMFRDIVILPRFDTLMAIFSRLSLENLNAGLESPSPIPDARPGTAGSEGAPLGSLQSASHSSGGYLESTNSMTSSTFASTRSRATSNTSAGSFSAHSIHSNPSTFLQPGQHIPASLRAQPMDSAKVTETVGRMLQCVSVLVSLQSGDDAQEKMSKLTRELKYNWLGRGRTGRQRHGFVGARRGGAGLNLAAGGVSIPGVGA